MERLERLIRANLAQRKWERTINCPSEVELSDYLEGRLCLKEREALESNLADCSYCLDLLIVAKGIVVRAKRDSSPIKRILKQKWLIASGASLLLSFFFSRYFLQFLVIALILGIKWALSPEGTKNLIMIFKSIRKEEDQEALSTKFFERK